MTGRECILFHGLPGDRICMRNVPWPPPMEELREIVASTTPAERAAMVAYWCASLFGERITFDVTSGAWFLRQLKPERFWRITQVRTPVGVCTMGDIKAFGDELRDQAVPPFGHPSRLNRAQRRAKAQR